MSVKCPFLVYVDRWRMQVIVVGDSDGPKDRHFYWHLVEDRASFTGGAMNYAEYMQHVNRQSVGGMAM